MPSSFQQNFASLASHPDVWQPTCAMQADVVSSEDSRLLVLGPRASGKTDSCFGAWIEHAERYGSAARGVFITPFHAQSSILSDRAEHLFGQIGATEHDLTRTWRFQNGASLHFAHCSDEDGADRYAGHTYSFMAVIQPISPYNGTGVKSESVLDSLLMTVRSPAGIPCRVIVEACNEVAENTWLGEWAAKRQFRTISSPVLVNPFLTPGEWPTF